MKRFWAAFAALVVVCLAVAAFGQDASVAQLPPPPPLDEVVEQGKAIQQSCASGDYTTMGVLIALLLGSVGLHVRAFVKGRK